MSRTILAVFLSLAGCGGDDDGDAGDADADADSDSDSDTTTEGGGDCESNCQAEATRCGGTADACISECEASDRVDFTAWTDCMNALSPPCTDFDESCCIASLGCRGCWEKPCP